MFVFDGFSQRLQTLRKEKHMTQEELAGRLGVSGQAVSKWENGQSYPDITSIPTLAAILDTEIDFLFGKVETLKDTPFPPACEEMPLVHSFQNTACYSSKDVASADGSGVKFLDGSTAELSSRLAVNTGKGEIRFLTQGDTDKQAGLTKTSKDFAFGDTESVDVEVYNNRCEIIRSADGKSKVRANGGANFIEMLDVRVQDKTLTVRFRDKERYETGPYQNNSVIIELPCETGRGAAVQINGQGELRTEIGHFDTGDLTVNGSGSIAMRGFKTCRASINGSGTITAIHAEEAELGINGSGDIKWDAAQRASISINGSGDVDIKTATSLNAGVNGSGDLTLGRLNGGGDFSARINGSGDIRVGGGSCHAFDVEMAGSGDVNAAEVTARKASITLHTDGHVTLGRVLESSAEQIKKKGVITILHRGRE